MQESYIGFGASPRHDLIAGEGSDKNPACLSRVSRHLLEFQKPALKFTQTPGLLTTVAAMFPAQWEKRLVDLDEEQECGRNYLDHSIMGTLHTQS